MSKKKDEKIKDALTHSSKTASSEPAWGTVDKTKLPAAAFATKGKNRSDLKYPHHWVQNGKTNDEGIYISGTMYLSRSGLRAALSAAGGARSGKKASSAIKAHLQRHASAIGMGEDDY